MNYQFSHIGIPTTADKEWDGFYEPGKIHFTEFDKDEYKVEWVKFDADSPMPELVRTVPHVAYQVPDMQEALKGKKVIVETFSPGEGVYVAFIEHKGSPVEFMQIDEQ
ncbi:MULTISPECIES: hypothetical protein [Reichenbachiella]|uniref:hypothetical protein n=1 Tax=Reichenbachiella TaxID=156993 RepID=UPI000E6C4E43|nr:MULTISPECIES: hypothetical protein [Reichenbachiella]MBU2912761.1 hypothetical protein [Reichenbachiella agariperforans]RJE72424.1 hypothetical protein BGP76_00085 [Reichenbachiella sp. MSK19-1]